MKLLPYGPEGWLVELPSDEVLGFAAAVERGRNPAIAEVLPAAATVLVRLSPGAPTAAVGAWLTTLTSAALEHEVFETVEIPVTYDGDDLPAVARATGLTRDEVVVRHLASPFVCAFCGFAPGFAYLGGLDPALHLPRRATPRTRVPAGAVAIADVYGAVYPSPSPGGWHLIGRTDATMWDVGRDRPALVVPGTGVRFVTA